MRPHWRCRGYYEMVLPLFLQKLPHAASTMSGSIDLPRRLAADDPPDAGLERRRAGDPLPLGLGHERERHPEREFGAPDQVTLEAEQALEQSLLSGLGGIASSPPSRRSSLPAIRAPAISGNSTVLKWLR
jgi:hypothetical protein